MGGIDEGDPHDSGLTYGLADGFHSQTAAQILVEEIVVMGVHQPIVTNLDSEEQGAGRFWKNNRFENTRPKLPSVSLSRPRMVLVLYLLRWPDSGLGKKSLVDGDV
ncbi:Ff.00g106500.m01.CDS01 [Fusarium sp. VM40]|nr:Ff.00g106500.m01.CDS01 [Fusarium sp. VM40]